MTVYGCETPKPSRSPETTVALVYGCATVDNGAAPGCSWTTEAMPSWPSPEDKWLTLTGRWPLLAPTKWHESVPARWPLTLVNKLLAPLLPFMLPQLFSDGLTKLMSSVRSGVDVLLSVMDPFWADGMVIGAKDTEMDRVWPFVMTDEI